MDRCKAQKKNGQPCGARVQDGEGFCWWHNASTKEERKYSAKKSSRTRILRGQVREIRAIKGQLSDLYENIREQAGEQIDTKTATCLLQITQGQLKAIDTERREKQAEELESRLEELEKKLEEKKKKGGDSPWVGTDYGG